MGKVGTDQLDTDILSYQTIQSSAFKPQSPNPPTVLAAPAPPQGTSPSTVGHPAIQELKRHAGTAEPLGPLQ